MPPAEPTTTTLIQLYLSKRVELVRFFTVRTSSAAEAEDIVQEMWIKLAAIDDASIENAGGFLYRLGSNVMLDRARTRRRSSMRDDAYYEAFRNGPRGGDSEDDLPSAEDVVDARQRIVQLSNLIKQMPQQRRRVFVMHKLEGLSYAEIAHSLGISRSAVEKHMIAALKQIGGLKR
jgi:RNA polymerase sigma factor (sigma-70 family)